jgi:lipopolysaccharide transport system permease protein
MKHLRLISYIWHHRYFVWSLVYRDLKLRYANSVLGLAWLVVEPMLVVLALSVAFKLVGRAGHTGNIPFPVFFFSGILPWNFMRHSFTDGTRVFVSDGTLLRKYAFPRELLAIKALFIYLVEFCISFMCLPILLLLAGMWPGVGWLWLIPVVMIQSVLVLGLILLFGSLNVYLRDFEKLNATLGMLLFWLTPIVFRLTPETKSDLFLHFNPFAGSIEAFREALLDDRAPQGNHLLWAGIWAAFFLIAGLFTFRKLEKGFTDVI